MAGCGIAERKLCYYLRDVLEDIFSRGIYRHRAPLDRVEKGGI
jgi:hypothetical protein